MLSQRNNNPFRTFDTLNDLSPYNHLQIITTGDLTSDINKVLVNRNNNDFNQYSDFTSTTNRFDIDLFNKKFDQTVYSNFDREPILIHQNTPISDLTIKQFLSNLMFSMIYLLSFKFDELYKIEFYKIYILLFCFIFVLILFILINKI